MVGVLALEAAVGLHVGEAPLDHLQPAFDRCLIAEREARADCLCAHALIFDEPLAAVGGFPGGIHAKRAARCHAEADAGTALVKRGLGKIARLKGERSIGRRCRGAVTRASKRKENQKQAMCLHGG